MDRNGKRGLSRCPLPKKRGARGIRTPNPRESREGEGGLPGAKRGEKKKTNTDDKLRSNQMRQEGKEGASANRFTAGDRCPDIKLGKGGGKIKRDMNPVYVSPEFAEERGSRKGHAPYVRRTAPHICRNEKRWGDISMERKKKKEGRGNS